VAPQPFVPAIDCAQVEIVGIQGGIVVESRLWFLSRFLPIDATLIENLAIGVEDWYSSQILPLLAVEYEFARLDAKDWNSTPPPNQFSLAPGTFGGNNSGIHSANVSIRVAFKGSSAQTFPNNANFVAGIPKDAVDGNVYTSTIRDGLFDAYVNLIDLAGTFDPSNTWRWVITSRQVDNAYRTEQAIARTDFILFPSPYVSPRRKRLTSS